jgi:hypothetical protein
MAKSAFIIDFDDTLVTTDSRILVTTAAGKTITLTPAEYVAYKKQPGDVFDYSHFEELVNPKPIARFTELLKKVLDRKAADKVIILTARGNAAPVHEFLKLIGIESGVAVANLGDSNPEKKSAFIDKLISKGYSKVMFIDDAEKNISAVNQLRTKHPTAKIVTHLADKMAAKSKKAYQAPSDRSSIQGLLNKKIKNVETGRDILVKSALRYDKKSPVYKSAIQFINRMK